MFSDKIDIRCVNLICESKIHKSELLLNSLQSSHPTEK